MSDKDEATRLADALEPVAVVYWSDIGHISWRSTVMLPDGTQLYAAPPDQSERIAALESALKQAGEALGALLTHMGMDEDEWNKPTFDQARDALRAIEEAKR